MSVPPLSEGEVYARIGEDGFARLVRAFYAQVPGDDVLGRMYPAHDLAGAEERLRDFLVGRFGGPPRYMEQRGHPRLRMRHMPFAIDTAARNRWVAADGPAPWSRRPCRPRPWPCCSRSSITWRRS